MSTVVYDLRGHKLQTNDPDMGTWTYSYDGAGELLSQVDAKSQAVTMQYDGLGRMTSRTEPDMASTWTYGIGGSTSANNQATYPNSAGKLVVMSCNGSACGTGNSYERDYTYTDKLQPYMQTITQGSASYWSRPLYDYVSGHIATVRYFSGYTIDENYNSTGYLSTITDDQTGFLIWHAATRDAELHLTLSDVGGGIVHEWQSFDGNTGRIINTCASSNLGACDGNLVNLSYSWDKIGNLASRSDAFANNTNPEYFCYDADSRVTDYSIHGSTCTAGANYALSYDALGNITAKTDINDPTCVTNNTPCYLYGTTGAGPHAVSEIIPCSTCFVDGINGGAGLNAYFYYDANGNLACVTPRTVCDQSAARNQTWTSFNMASQVTQGGTTISWTYDPSHQRASETESVGGSITNYANYPEIGVMAERVQTGGKLNWRNYIMADGHMVAIRTALSGQSPQMFYPVLDHLGSMAALIDGNMLTPTGQPNQNYSLAITRYSYDAFGMARDPVNWTPVNCSKGPQPPFVRGFTGQEHLPDNVCLINFNARMYDPQIGRFLSADPTIEAIYDGQDLNRYSYVLNNPLALTDPSGYGGFFQSMLFRSLAGIAAAALMEYELLPLIEGTSFGALTASAGLAAQAGTVNTATFALAANAGLAGGAAGAISTGTLKGALLSGAEALAFYGVGSGLQTEGGSLVFNSPTATAALAHGMVGGMFSIGQKGGFVSGFVAAAISPTDNSASTDAQVAADVATQAVAGGVGAVLGGGKFANGAVTGAFAYLFNDSVHRNQAMVAGAAGGSTGVAVGSVAVDAATGGLNIVATPLEISLGGLIGGTVGWIGAAFDDLRTGSFYDKSSHVDALPDGPKTSAANPDRPTDRAIKDQCIQRCYPLLERWQPPGKWDKNENDFHQCVAECIREKQEYWDER